MTIDSGDFNKKTKSAFIYLQVITCCCHAVENTTFTASTPKPKWFDGLNGKLDVAKANAKDWVDNLAVDATSSIPTSVIDYDTTYKALAQQIQDIAKAHPNAKGKDNQYVQQVQELLDALISSVGDIITSVKTLGTKLTAWGDKIQASHDDLQSGAADIQKAEVALEKDIAKMTAAIQKLNGQIDDENTKLALSAGAVGIGVFLLVVGLALAPVTGGLSLLVSAVGAVGIVGGAVSWSDAQKQIDTLYSEIAVDQSEKTDDQKQLVALQGLAAATDLVVKTIAKASLALSGFGTQWGVFQKELQGVKTKLDAADKSLDVIVQGALSDGAQDEWDIAVAFAEKLTGAPAKVESKTLPMSSAAA
jgi:hypothetical protein